MNRLALLSTCAILLAAGTGLADTITRHDGTRLTGKITSEETDVITLQSNIGELITRTRVARKDIASIERTPQHNAAWCRIPIEGDIGTAVRAQWLEKAISQARALKATHIILSIDSGGGHVDEMIKIIELIKDNDDLKFIAHVKNAGSAAAIIAMACSSIILTPDGSIGAAVPYRISPNGTPQNVEAKFFSYFSSVARAAADTGGHSTLLVRGMMETDLVLSRITTGKRVQIIEGQVSGAVVIKRRGEILTLQGREALDAGLASAITVDVVETPGLVGVQSWISVGDGPWSFIKARQNALADARKDSQALRDQIAAATAQASLAQETGTKLAEQYKREAVVIYEAYNKAVNVRRPPSEINAGLDAAKNTRDAQIASLKARYQSLIDEQQRAHQAAVATFNTASAKLQQIQSELNPPKTP